MNLFDFLVPTCLDLCQSAPTWRHNIHTISVTLKKQLQSRTTYVRENKMMLTRESKNYIRGGMVSGAYVGASRPRPLSSIPVVSSVRRPSISTLYAFPGVPGKPRFFSNSKSLWCSSLPFTITPVLPCEQCRANGKFNSSMKGCTHHIPVYICESWWPTPALHCKMI